MDISEEEFLEHYGVLGMHWGVRRRRDEGTLTRGAAIDRNARQRAKLNLAKSGKKFRVTAAIGRAFVGREQQRTYWNQRIKNLNAQDHRIRRGKITIADRLEMYATTSLFDLAISRRPK